MEKNYYKEAQDIFRNKREAAERERAQRLMAVHARLPEVKKIDEVLSMTGAEILVAMMSGGDTDKKVAAIRARNDELREKRRAILEENGYSPDHTAVKYECES
ncbi:MAG: hypothetical protein IJD22_05695, partial [Clostridia bacterium]|nr:hypothetical protein [Clostridia bacterium]